VKQDELIEALKSRMTALDVEKLSILQEDDKALSNKYASYNKLLEKQHKQDIQPYLDKVNAAIADYARSNKIDYVWIVDQLKPALAYINQGKDITSTIVGIVNKKVQ
jgi:Skp family chaperone for outer membrane proteins